jgi:hypothetical protein
MILFSLVFTSCTADPAIKISSYELSPSVLMPGDEATLTLNIHNAESTSTRTVATTSSTTTTTIAKTSGAIIGNVWIASAYDNTMQIKTDSNYDQIGVIAPGSTIAVTFKLDCDEGFSNGLYFPMVHVDLESDSYEDVYYPLPVRVSDSGVDLLSTEIPSQISVGGSTEITLTALNNRENTVDCVTITPSELDGMEFMPKSKYIGTMTSYSSEDVSFSLIPSESGEYNLLFNVSFKNGNNTHYNELTIPITVIETLDVAPVFNSVPTKVEKGQSTHLRLEVYNAKTESISGVIVTPITNVRVSPSQYFIGSMDPDDVFSASFDIYTDDLIIDSNYSIDFKVSFKQGENYFETPAISSSFKVIKPSDSGGGGNMFLYGGVFLFIIMILLIIYFIRKKRRIIR